MYTCISIIDVIISNKYRLASYECHWQLNFLCFTQNIRIIIIILAQNFYHVLKI